MTENTVMHRARESKNKDMYSSKREYSRVYVCVFLLNNVDVYMICQDDK